MTEENKNEKLVDLYNKIKFQNYRKIIFIKNQEKIYCFNEDALFIKRMLHYKVFIHGNEGEESRYLKTTFPAQRFQIISAKIKKDTNVPYVLFEIEENELILKIESNFKTKKRKSDFINKDDVSHYLQDYDNDIIEKQDFTITQIKRGETKEYMLKTKAEKLFTLINDYIIKYTPRKQQVLIDKLLEKWTDLISEIKVTQYDTFINKIPAHCQMQ